MSKQSTEVTIVRGETVTTHPVKRLCAYDQAALLHILSDIMPALFGLQTGRILRDISINNALTLLEPLAATTDDRVEEIVAACRAACEGLPDDLSMMEIVALVSSVASANYGPYFTYCRSRVAFRPASRDASGFKPVSLPGNKDWLFRPVIRGKCQAESLWNGALHIEQIAELNDALDVADENEYRAHKAVEKR